MEFVKKGIEFRFFEKYFTRVEIHSYPYSLVPSKSYRMDDHDCFNLDELNDSLIVTTTARKPKKETFRPSEIKIEMKQNNECDVDEIFHASFESFFKYFCEQIFLLKLQQKQTDSVFELCSNLVREYSKLLTEVLFTYQTNGTTHKEIIMNEMENVCSEIDKMNGAQKRRKLIEQSELYVRPIEKNIGIRWRCKSSAAESIPNHILKSNTYHSVPLIKKIQSLFARPAFRKMFFDYNCFEKHTCKEGVYVDYCCGANAAKCEIFKQEHPVIMIDLAADAFEVCSPLKTKTNTHKQMGIYFRIRNLPPVYNSRSNNYHLVALCNTEHLKEEGNSFNSLIESVMEEMRHLETVGIGIGMEKNILGTLIHFCGDNLGSNEAFGFIKCFSTDYFCRMCYCTKAESEIQTFEIPNKMRDESSYMELVQKAGSGTYKDSKGIVSYCLFNDSKYFSIFKNFTVDIMHDINEGVGHRLLKIIFDFILENRVMNSIELISIIRDFNYGPLGPVHS